MKIALIHPGPVGCGQPISRCRCTCSHCGGPVAQCECHCGRCEGALHTTCFCARPHVIAAGTAPRIAVFSDEYVGGTVAVRPLPQPRTPHV